MQPTWIFERGGKYLMLHCREYGRGVTLVVRGDGDLRSYSFHDFAALMKFATEMEDFLRETGWTPARMTIEAGYTAHAPDAKGGATSIGTPLRGA